MADKRKAPVAPEGALRRKRAAPTIDLTATEVPPASESDERPPAAAAEPLPHEPPTDPPPHQTAAEPPAEAPPPGNAPHDQAAPAPGGDSGFSIATLAAGFIGAGLVAVVVAALWFSGLLPVGTGEPADMSAQFAALQKQIHDLQNRPAATSAPDSQTIDMLSQRVGKIESTLANLPKSSTDMAQRLNAAENAMTSLGLALAALNKRSDDIATDATRARVQAEAADNAVTQLRGSVQSAAKDASAAVAPEQLTALQQRVAALEQSAKAAREVTAKTAAAATATRRALSATALRSAVVNGAPFIAELAQAKSFGADDKILVPLQPFAASGLPSAATLAQELRALIPALQKSSGARVPSGSFFERLQANAGKLVRIQPVNAPPGDDPAAVLARVEIATSHADIGGALADLGKLPETARAPAQDWIKKAQARQAALAAARTFAADMTRSLGQE
jgi:hypothetical protein